MDAAPSMQDVPSKLPRPRRLRRPVLAGLAAVGLGGSVVLMAMLIAAATTPAFYRGRLVVGEVAAAEQAARRLITKMAGLQAAASRIGPWESAVTEEEINSWLTVDLPRNHVAALPAGVTAPRVELADRMVRLGVRVGAGPLSAVVSCGLEIRMREVNQVECVVADARLGALPLPRGPILHALAARLEPLGLLAEVRRGDGRSVLVVTLPGSLGQRAKRCVLEALAVSPGELLMAGETKEAR